MVLDQRLQTAHPRVYPFGPYGYNFFLEKKLVPNIVNCNIKFPIKIWILGLSERYKKNDWEDLAIQIGHTMFFHGTKWSWRASALHELDVLPVAPAGDWASAAFINTYIPLGCKQCNNNVSYPMLLSLFQKGETELMNQWSLPFISVPYLCL